MRKKRHTKKIFTLKHYVFIALLLCSLFGTIASTQDLGNIPTITLEKATIYVNTSSLISIANPISDPNITAGYTLRIEGPQSLRYTTPLEPLPFKPSKNGTYTIMLYNAKTGDVYDEKILVVDIPPKYEALNDAAFSSRFITLEKDSFGIQESVAITINYRLEDFSLRLISPSNVFNFLGEPSRDILFSPRELGQYELQLVVNQGIIERKFFTVTQEIQNTPRNLPNTNIKNKVRDSKGIALAASNILIKENGRTVQSNIDTTKRYEVQLRVDNSPVKEVSFKNVKMQRELDIGMESLPPKYSPEKNARSVAAFALDPTKVDFTQGTMTVVAPGTGIYKCVDYNFTTQECFGEHVRIMNTTPGELVEISFDALDPLYTFVDSSIACSCQDTASGNSGTISCNVHCAVTVNGPGAGAEDGFIEEIRFVAALTVTTDGATMSNAYHDGFFEHDTNTPDGDEQEIGSSTATATSTLTWTATGLPSAGASSFNSLDCNNWPTDCSNYQVYLNTTLDFQAPGKSSRSPIVNISLSTLNVTWNYSVAGSLSVVLNEPTNLGFYNSRTVPFNFTPSTTATAIDTCSLYSNEAGWAVENSSSSITKNVSNILSHTFSSDGTYLWNVFCNDTDTNTDWGNSNFTLTVDTLGPNVTVYAPVNNSIETGSTVTFTYNVTDTLGDIDNCSLYVNGSVQDTDTGITEGQNNSFISPFFNGDYSWYVACYDEAGNLNTSETRYFTQNSTPVFWTERFYESDTSGCAGTGTCEISLEQTTDGSVNTKTVVLPGGDSLTSLVNATSSYFGGNGVFLPSGETVTFSAYFSAYASGTPFVTWRLYALRANNSQELVCSFGNDDGTGSRIQSVGAEVQTCVTSQDFTFAGNDRLRLEINVFNDHPSQDSTITHDWDYVDSYVDLGNLYTIGTLSVELVDPTTNITIDQGGLANITCNTTCTNGYCLNTSVYAQYRAVGASGWTNISTSGNLTLNTGEVNPHDLGSFPANLSNSTNETFEVVGNQTSTNEIQCYAQSDFGFASSSNVRRIIVGDSNAPIVTLLTPPEAEYINTTLINFTYNVTDAGGLANCSLLINDTINTTDTSPTNPGENNFTVPGFTQGEYNWTVICVDSSGFQGNASEVRNFSVDLTRPSIQLNAPPNATNIAFSFVTFNWTVTDNRAENATCSIYINGTLNQSGLQSTPGVARTSAITGFNVGSYSWNVACLDVATNYNVSETRIFNITDNPPVVTLNSPPDGSYTGNMTVQVTYNASDNNALVSCDLYFDGVFNQTNQTPIINNQLNPFNITGVTDGLHNWTVNCTDGTFTDQAAEWDITVDTVSPSLVLLSPIDTQLTSSSVTFSLNFTDSLSPNGTCDIQYNTSASTNLVTGVTAISGAATNQPETGLIDGEYSWNATCYDLGNNSNATTQEIFNVSQVPTVTLNAPAANSYNNGQNVNFTFTPNDNDGFVNCTLRLLSGPNVSDTINQTPIVPGAVNGIVLTDLAEGTHTWSVACYDNGTFGNSAQPLQRLFTVDATTPNASLISPVDEIVNSSTVNLNWTTEDNVDFTLSCDLWINGVVNVSSIASSSGDFTNYSIANFSNGEYNWSVNCSDDAGNFNMTPTAYFNVSVPPSVELTDPADGVFLNYLEGVTFGYTPSSNAALDNCTLYIDGVENETNTSPAQDVNSFFFINFSASEEGFHEWNVLCSDVDGLQGDAPANFTFYLDISGPNINLTTPSAGENVSNNNVSFAFTPTDLYSPNMTCNLTVDGFPERENIVVLNGTEYNTTLLFPDGTYLWNVTCADVATNLNTSETRNFTVYAPPNVTLLAPENNSIENTTSITLFYLPEDGFPIDECNLTVNGVVNQTDSSPVTGANNSFTLNNLSEGVYSWYVGCLDQDDHLVNASTQYFTVDLFPPNITLYTPIEGQNFSVDDVTFNFTAIDTLDTNLTCNLTIDNIVNQSNLFVVNATPYAQLVENFTDAVHYWNVTCIDDAFRSNISETRSFNISVAPNITLGTPINNTWTNVNPLVFNFTPTDNDGFAQCTLQLDGFDSTTNSTITNNAENYIANGTLSDGIYNWSVTCVDNGTYSNTFTSINWTVNYDTTAPTFTLYEPSAGQSLSELNVIFNYSIFEELSPYANCSIILDGSNITFEQVTNGTIINNSYVSSYGLHYWNVTCTDFAGNTGISALRNFTIFAPDIVITSANITFSNTSTIEGDTVTIFANVYNIGQGAATNFTVQFFLGDPDVSGVQIGTNQTISGLSAGSNQTINITHTTVIGTNNIFVRVDTPFATNGTLTEENESNNEANNSITVGHYEIFSGTTNDELTIDDASLTSLFVWDVENVTSGTLFVTDIDSTIDFTNMTALSRDTSGVFQADDFAELDVELASTNYADSINDTYTAAGTPIQTRAYTIFSSTIANVPVVNSTNTSSFQTGILWDASDGGSAYNGSQDVIFISSINNSQVGFYGTYDYEIKVPATLRDYRAGSSLVSFYAEISG